MDLSIILVNYNTKDLTRNCLKSIFETVSGINFDVWVVDNNSHDGSCEMIESEFPQVNLIKSDKNLGFGCANNLAIEQSTSKYVFLLNTDTLLINNAPKILFDFMEKTPEAGACGGNLYNESGQHVHSYGYIPTLKTKFVKTFFLKYLFPCEKVKIDDKGNNEKNEFKQVDQIIGADLFLRRETIEKTGLFDKDFFLYFEESELQYRILKEGYKIFIIPDAKIYHFEGKSMKIRKAKTEAKLKSEYLFYKKCYGIKKQSPLKLMFMVSHLLRMIIYPVLILKVWKFIIEN